MHVPIVRSRIKRLFERRPSPCGLGEIHSSPTALPLEKQSKE